MNDLPILKVTFPEAQELAHLAALSQDLKFVMQATSRLSTMLQEESSDYVVRHSLFTAALVAYVRCFTSGKRVGLSPEIFSELPGEPLATHQWYKDTRDKHVAHSVNPFEHMHVGVVLSPREDSDRKVLGTACITASLVSFDREGIDQLGSLAQVAHNYVIAEAKKLEQRVQEIASAMDIDELYESTPLGFTAQGGAEAAASSRGA